jgi:hypothetical protein
LRWRRLSRHREPIDFDTLVTTIDTLLPSGFPGVSLVDAAAAP